MPPIRTFATPRELGSWAAGHIADLIEQAAGRPFLLGCPGGRSPAETYAALADETRRRRLDLRGLVVVMMDEYLGPDLRSIDAREPHSCRRFGREHIVDPLNAATAAGITDDRFWMPDPADPAAYDDRIAQAGGIDVFLLATGASDGHIAFNPPGTPAGSRTRIIPLAQSTRRDNLATFPTLRAVENVPTHGVSVGIDTIRRLSHRAVLIAHGPDKAAAAERIAAADHYDPQWPSTVLSECSEPLLLVDAAAAAGLDSTVHD